MKIRVRDQTAGQIIGLRSPHTYQMSGKHLADIWQTFGRTFAPKLIDIQI